MNENPAESKTERLFRDFYGNNNFIEKREIPKEKGFKSKQGTGYDGFPDFYREGVDFDIVVEVKKLTSQIRDAEKEVMYYMKENNIDKDIIGIAVAGQRKSSLKITYYYKAYKFNGQSEFKELGERNYFLSIDDIVERYRINHYKLNDNQSLNNIKAELTQLNKTFHSWGGLKDTDRSLLFSGLMIALKDNNFREIYQNIKPPINEEDRSLDDSHEQTVAENKNLTEAIIKAINTQLSSKTHRLSTQSRWDEVFSFIKNISCSLQDFKKEIAKIERRIYTHVTEQSAQDMLGSAYKIFMKRNGGAENRNIILTPDHIKELMVDLAELKYYDVVLDSCMGSGGFLLKAMEVMIDDALRNDTVSRVDSIREKQLIGFETDSTLFTLACCNMYLHGDGKTCLLNRSSLLTESEEIYVTNTNEELLSFIKKQKVTKIIINPPYEGNKPIKFTKEAINFLTTNGKLIIIMPVSTIKKNIEFAKNNIFNQARLDYVIKMPVNLFSEQNRTVNTAIFGFTKTKHLERDETLFYTLLDDGFTAIQHKGRIDEKNSWERIKKEICDTISNKNENGKICYKQKILSNGVYQFPLISSVVRGKYDWKPIDEIFEVQQDKLQSSKCDTSGKYIVITAGDGDPKRHTSYEHDCEAIVYTVDSGGSLGKAHYVNDKFTATNLCVILTPTQEYKDKINMRFYTYYFNYYREEIKSDLGSDKTAKNTISVKEFKKYYIDVYPKALQDEFVNDYIIPQEKLQSQLNELKQQTQMRLHNFIKV